MEPLLGLLVVLVLFFWAVFVWLWARKYEARRRRLEKPRPKRWEVPSDYWRN